MSQLKVALANAGVRTVVGYIVCWFVADELHILNLAVHPLSRRQGIAKRLVLAAIKHARHKGARRAFLEVRSSNTAAQNLYSDLGFTGTSVRREYYDSPVEDAVVMALGEGALLNLAKSA